VKKIFLSPSDAKNPGNITAKKFQSTNYITTSFIGTTKREENYQQCGEDHVFGLTLKPLGYGTCNIFNADPAGLRRPFDMPLH
jgi:hypothetical protein